MTSFDGFDGKDTRPPGSWSTKRARNVDGQEITESTEGYSSDNLNEKIISTNYKTAADGRELPVTNFIAKSWSGHHAPQDRLFTCLNPFGRHELRLVYLEIDGFATDLDNVLCTECFEVNKKRETPIDFPLLGPILCWLLRLFLYNPEIF